jgi:hypothetical protein
VAEWAGHTVTVLHQVYAEGLAGALFALARLRAGGVAQYRDALLDGGPLSRWLNGGGGIVGLFPDGPPITAGAAPAGDRMGWLGRLPGAPGSCRGPRATWRH